MFRTMRKKNREISTEQARQLLKDARRGVLAVNGENGYPYAVPINYIYDEENEKIIFHGSKYGQKIDAIKANDKICFTVYGNETIKDEEWAPYLQSVIIFGKCHLIEDFDEGIEQVKKMSRKYYPCEELINVEVSASGHSVQMFEIEIEHMTGKEIQER